jgi:hypothetical protein
MAYNYYHGRLGLPMPNTALVLSKPGVRPEGYGLMTGIGYGTLTIYPYSQSTGLTPVALTPTIQLRSAVPNPFNPRTTLRFDLAETAHVRLRIYDVAGRLVKTLTDAEIAAGPHNVEWDARADDGQSVASGVYLAKLEADGFTATTRLALVR